VNHITPWLPPSDRNFCIPGGALSCVTTARIEPARRLRYFQRVPKKLSSAKAGPSADADSFLPGASTNNYLNLSARGGD